MTEKSLSNAYDYLSSKFKLEGQLSLEEQTICYILEILDAITLPNMMANLNQLISENTASAFEKIGAVEYAKIFEKLYQDMLSVNSLPQKGLFARFKINRKLEDIRLDFIHAFKALDQKDEFISNYLMPYVEKYVPNTAEK